MIHAQMDATSMRPLCLWLCDEGDLVSSTESLVSCPLCRNLLPAWKDQLAQRIADLQNQVQEASRG